MPTPDYAPRRAAAERLRIAQERAAMHRLHERLADRLRRGGKRRDGEAGESVPVEPNRPSNLSGGAAAALEFDD